MPFLPRREEYRRLIAAIENGDPDEVALELLETDPWLGYYGGGAGTVLEAVGRCRGDRLGVLRVLVEAGVDVSKAEFDPEAEAVVDAVLREGPTWRREAREMGIREIGIVREKAWGLAFVPGDGQLPLRYGGGYDGSIPYTAAAALAELDRDLADQWKATMARRARWYRPFLVKMVRTEDFSLRDVIARLPDERSILR